MTVTDTNKQPQKVYAGIGSRETPMHILQVMGHIAGELALRGWTLRSGAADGADTAFEKGCDAAEGKKEIFLPWQGFNGRSTTPSVVVADRLETFVTAKAHAEYFHPAWDRCSSGAKKLHTRNVFQIGGSDLASTVDMVVCWTAGGQRGGGTGQALRIAEHLEVPIFDLAVPGIIEDLWAFVKELEDEGYLEEEPGRTGAERG